MDPLTFTVPMAYSGIPAVQGLCMASTLSADNPAPKRDSRTLRSIREKFREVFGCETSMKDEVLVQRYRVSGDGDLIMILR